MVQARLAVLVAQAKPPPSEIDQLGLTEQELHILDRLACGWKDALIAKELGRSERMVRNYVRALLDKTGLQDRTALAVWAVRQGFGKD
jgi:DNA-binding NarL/FixJ family response regulator